MAPITKTPAKATAKPTCVAGPKRRPYVPERCTKPLADGDKYLCKEHRALYREQAKAAPKTAASSKKTASKSAGSSPKAAGAQKPRSAANAAPVANGHVPPTPMHVPPEITARVHDTVAQPIFAPALVNLVTVEGEDLTRD